MTANLLDIKSPEWALDVIPTILGKRCTGKYSAFVDVGCGSAARVLKAVNEMNIADCVVGIEAHGHTARLAVLNTPDNIAIVNCDVRDFSFSNIEKNSGGPVAIYLYDPFFRLERGEQIYRYAMLLERIAQEVGDATIIFLTYCLADPLDVILRDLGFVRTEKIKPSTSPTLCVWDRRSLHAA